MILPGNYITTLILLILGMVCLGSWAVTFKSSSAKWRFELYYFDFGVGVFIAATIIALTFGSFGFDGFSFTDDLRLAGKKQDMFGLAAGALFNFGNMFLVAALSMAEMSVVFPISMGFALVVSALLTRLVAPAGSRVYLFLGVAVVIVAIVIAVMALRQQAAARLLESMRAGKSKSTKKVVSWKAVIVCLISGFFIGTFFPLVVLGRAGENGLGPYSMGWLFAFGVMGTTFVFNLFFMNLPIQGQPVDIAAFFRARFTMHLKGLLGGVLWYIALITSLVAARAEGHAQVQPFLVYGLGQLAIVIAALWGILRWKEFSDADSRVKIEIALMFVLLIAGIGLTSGALVSVNQ